MTDIPRTPRGKRLWAYAYDAALPEEESRLRRIQELLDQEGAEARSVARTWAGRMVVEPQVTRILVVSDSPMQDRDFNFRIEAELKRLGASFKVTVPMAVTNDVASTPENGRGPL